MEFVVKKYQNEDAALWDRFVMEEAVNGTFLQTRNFLNYHPDGKFEDHSVLVYNDRGNLAAVCPACCVQEDGEKVFYSHPGSTFGGIIINKRHHDAEKVIQIIDVIEKYVEQNAFSRIFYKQTSDLFCQVSNDLFEYCFYYRKYSAYDELNLYISFKHYKEELLSNLSQGKRTNVHNCEKAGMVLQRLETDSEIATFHSILCDTLGKYDLKPVHTVQELLDFHNARLKDNCEFYGIFFNGEMVAGSMLFLFHNVGTAHTQYLCARAEYNKYSPMSYMYYCMIKLAKERGYKRLSWGITSEHKGLELNMGLTKSKEAFGSEYSVSKIYYKVLSV